MAQFASKVSLISITIFLLRGVSAASFTTPSKSTITPRPELRIKRDSIVFSGTNDPYFMGYYLTGASEEYMTCVSPATWSSSSSWAGCCTGSNCFLGTTCSGNTLMYNFGSTICGGTSSCSTMTIIQSSPYGGATQVDVECYENWSAATVFRQLATSTTTTSTSISSSSLTSSSTPTSTTPLPTATITISPTPTPTPAPTKSNAWIAAVVAVPIAILAILGVMAWIWRRKQAQQKHTPAYRAPEYQSEHNYVMPALANQYPHRDQPILESGTGVEYNHGNNRRSELHG